MGVLLALFRKQPTKFQKRALRILHQAGQPVHEIDFLALTPIALSRSFSFPDDPIDFVLRQTGGWRNAHLLLATGGLIRGRDRNNSIGVDFEGYFNLRYATRGRGNSHQLELSQAAIASGDFPLALKDMNFDGRLIVDDRCKSQTVTQRNS